MTEDSRLFPSFISKVPAGDSLTRQVCETCGFIDYVNPKIVVGSVVRFQDKYLLCKRAIEPRKGFWTLPAGFLEEGETLEEGTLREAYEEALIRPVLGALLAIYSVPHISQIHIFYRARLETADFAPGPESQAVELYSWQDIPWPDLAFPSVEWALKAAWEVEGKKDFPPFTNPE